MRLLLALLLVLGTADTVLATDWRFLAAHDDQSVALYYDRHSVRTAGAVVKVRIKRVFAEDEGREIAAEQGFAVGVAYAVERVSLDCANKRISRQQSAWIGIDGKTLDRTVAPTQGWRAMRQGGLGEALCRELD
ncbi:MAG: surface-adhesin E family protein [Acidobacteriota bacterium]